MKPGENELVVAVTNLWPNRLIGDARFPEEIEWQARKPLPARWPDWLLRKGEPRPAGPRVAFSTRKVYGENDPLLPSGLLGPVTISAAVVATIEKQ